MHVKGQAMKELRHELGNEEPMVTGVTSEPVIKSFIPFRRGDCPLAGQMRRRAGNLS